MVSKEIGIGICQKRVEKKIKIWSENAEEPTLNGEVLGSNRIMIVAFQILMILKAILPYVHIKDIRNIFHTANRLTHTLLPKSFCSLEHFTSKWLGALCFTTHFAPQNTLLPDILYSSAHFAPKTLFSSEHFASWNTLLTRTLCFLCSI